ncbi:MAG TPA: ABC transporter ATP-binding protein [Gemmatimonadales bacterium]|nr:ABC transporter ATP-binding protein [Gemmatimonadales bacterium]
MTDVRRASCVVRDLRYRYPGAQRDALTEVSFSVQPGQFHAVLGPNGSGKTTLVRIALGALRPLTGSVTIGDKPAHEWSRQELARIVGVVPQREDNLFPQRVRETVLLGRYPHLSMWGRERADDHAAVQRALAACDAEQLADRWVWSLSGGEYQRVRIARALAQEPKLLVLDEPGISLDLRHEMGLFELVRSLVDSRGLGVLMITHDLNLAARFADSLLLLRDGRPVAAGDPGAVLTQEVVESVFAWPVAMQTIDGRPQMVPLRQSKETR